MALVAMLSMGGLSLLYFQTGINAISRPASSDFYKFYLSAQRVIAGQSMYWLVPPREQRGDACHPDTPDDQRQSKLPRPGPLTLGGELPCLAPNLNPPVFMTLMLPLSLVTYEKAWWIWAAFSSICALIGVWLLTGVRTQAISERVFWMLTGSAAIFAYYPTLASFSMGQVGAVLLPLIVTSWLDLKRGRSVQSGCWLGLAIGLKPFLGVLLLGLIALRFWRTLASAVVVLLGTHAIGVWLFGLDAYKDYGLVASNVSWTTSNWNGSWFGFFDRFFSAQANSNWSVHKQLSKTLGAACAMLTLGMWLGISRQQKQRFAASGIDALFALGLPTALLVSPLGWVYYFPLLTLSGFIAWQRSSQATHPRPMRLALMLPVVMAMVPILLKPSPSPLNPTLWWGIDAWYFYTLTSGFVVCALLIHRDRVQH